MRPAGESRDVVARSAPIVDLGEHHDRDPLVERARDLFAANHAQLMRRAEPADKSVRYVEVGREVAPLGQDDVPARPQLECGGEQLEQVDRGRIGDQHLVRRSADTWPTVPSAAARSRARLRT